MIVALALAAALAVDDPPLTAQMTVPGAGGETCGVWQAEREQGENSSGRQVFISWVLGFLAARSIGDKPHDRDYLAHTDYSVITAWMDNYCSSHPTDFVISAAMNFETELGKRP
jgi:hypothetical protein